MNAAHMRAFFLVALLCCSFVSLQGATANNTSNEHTNMPPTCNAQRDDWTVGLISCSNDSHVGYTLFSPFPSTTTYLIDNEGREINSWQSPGNHRPGAAAYMLEDGSLLRTGDIGGQSPGNFTGGGIGGKLERIGWDGTLEWSWEYSSTMAIMHHDIEPMPNGNILAIAWEDKTEQEALNSGRNPAIASDAPGGQGNVWPDHIIEIQPVGSNDATIVWEWHAWDHLIQDYDSNQQNFGIVEDHPELLNINYVTQTGNQAGRADWMHCNGIDYNEQLDQILLSCRGMDEIYIIDHSTTTAEAAGHSGGTYGKGGDFLYRWGNSQVYKKGLSSNQQLFGQHDAQWIQGGHPDEGKLIIFNNGIGRENPYSSVDIIEPNSQEGTYSLLPNGTFGPLEPSWTWTKEGMYASVVSGAQGLSNGNILVSLGTKGTLYEISQSGELVWTYINPIGNNGSFAQRQSLPQGNLAGTTANMLFKSYRYEIDYPGLTDKDLTPGSYLESWTDSCPQEFAWKWDVDGDGCIDDIDQDGVNDPFDRCWLGDDTVDEDQDSVPDACDSFVDADDDGIEDGEDICEGYDDSIDSDNDNIPDGCDELIDSDLDGVSDENDECPGHNDTEDDDQDGIANGCDPTPSKITENLTDGDENNIAGTDIMDSDSTAISEQSVTTKAMLGYLLMLLGLWLFIYLALIERPNEESVQKNFPTQDTSNSNQNLKTYQQPLFQEESKLPPLPATGLPEGWTIEQWNYYGHQWLEINQQ